MKKKILIYITSLLTLSLFSQDFKTSLEKIENKNQNCLDKGRFMYNCSLKFYKQADSLLNVVYRHIRKDMVLSEKENLKKEQLAWLKEREKQFNKINNQNTEFGNGLDDLTIKKDKKAKIVNYRTAYLIEKYVDKRNRKTINFEKISGFLDENLLPIICKFLNIKLEKIQNMEIASKRTTYL